MNQREFDAVASKVSGFNIEEFETVKRWLTRLSKKKNSPNTKRGYLKSLGVFCEFAGMTPDELIREKENASGFKPEDRLDEWFKHLTEAVSPKTHEKLKRGTCVFRYNAVRSFYKANRMELKPEDAPTSWVEKEIRPLTHSELGRLLNATVLPMHKVYILCQAQSGLGVSDLLNVPYGDVAKQVESGQDYVHIRFMRGKEKQLGFFDSFFGRMSVEALKEYLPEHGESDVLFTCKSRNVDDFLQRLSSKAGLEWNVNSHALRKFFNTNLKMTRINDPRFNETLIEYWMGHSLGKVRGAYFIPPWEEQLKLYKQAETRLEPRESET